MVFEHEKGGLICWQTSKDEWEAASRQLEVIAGQAWLFLAESRPALLLGSRVLIPALQLTLCGTKATQLKCLGLFSYL